MSTWYNDGAWANIPVQDMGLVLSQLCFALNSRETYLAETIWKDVDGVNLVSPFDLTLNHTEVTNFTLANGTQKPWPTQADFQIDELGTSKGMLMGAQAMADVVIELRDGIESLMIKRIVFSRWCWGEMCFTYFDTELDKYKQIEFLTQLLFDGTYGNGSGLIEEHFDESDPPVLIEAEFTIFDTDWVPFDRVQNSAIWIQLREVFDDTLVCQMIQVYTVVGTDEEEAAFQFSGKNAATIPEYIIPGASASILQEGAYRRARAALENPAHPGYSLSSSEYGRCEIRGNVVRDQGIYEIFYAGWETIRTYSTPGDLVRGHMAISANFMADSTFPDRTTPEGVFAQDAKINYPVDIFCANDLVPEIVFTFTLPDDTEPDDFVYPEAAWPTFAVKKVNTGTLWPAVRSGNHSWGMSLTNLEEEGNDDPWPPDPINPDPLTHIPTGPAWSSTKFSNAQRGVQIVPNYYAHWTDNTVPYSEITGDYVVEDLEAFVHAIIQFRQGESEDIVLTLDNALYPKVGSSFFDVFRSRSSGAADVLY